MFIRFSPKGIKYLTVLSNGGLIPFEEMFELSGLIMELPGANTLEAAAAFLSDRFKLDLYGELLLKLDKKQVRDLKKRKQDNAQIID